MKKPISPEAIKQLFTEARSYNAWQPKPVTESTFHEIYELAKWGPTSANASPMRIVFVTTEEGKAKLIPTLMGGNVEQVKAAPVTAIIAHDEKFYDHLGKLFPAADLRGMFAGNAALAESTAFRNSSLQGAYFILACRALGLDTRPMSGFDNAKLDEAFFKGTAWKSNFICTMGYGDDSKLYPRGPRLDFKDVCKIV